MDKDSSVDLDTADKKEDLLDTATENLAENHELIANSDNIAEPVQISVESSSESNEVSLETVSAALPNEQEFTSPAAVENSIPEIDYENEIARLQTERQKLEELAPELLDKVENQKKETTRLSEWIELQRTSFLWKVLSRMKSNSSEVDSKLSEYQNFVDNLEVPETGQLQAIRKRFHRGLLRTWSLVVAIAALLIYLPKFIDQISGNNRFVQLVTSQNYPSNLRIILSAVTVLIISLISLLIQYYRDWSEFERRVVLALWKLDEISKGVLHCRDEKARLSVLYPQVRDWLEIIGNSLHTPWNIDEKWIQSISNEIPQDDFPYSLRIAQAQEDDRSSALQLRRDAAERFLLQGWRSKVFVEQVRVAQEMMGLTEDRLNVEMLDSDIALSPGGPRAILREKIKDPELLAGVAKRQLLPLMKIVQIESIAQARPPVRENRTDLLDLFKVDDLGLGLNTKVAWDSFLTQSMGDSQKPRTPLSLLAFSESGRQVGHHDRGKTIFISPDRLIVDIPNNDSTFVHGYSETTRLPMDIVVRMDIVGPLPQDDVLILERSREEIQHEQSSYQQNIRAAIDPNKSGV